MVLVDKEPKSSITLRIQRARCWCQEAPLQPDLPQPPAARPHRAGCATVRCAVADRPSPPPWASVLPTLPPPPPGPPQQAALHPDTSLLFLQCSPARRRSPDSCRKTTHPAWLPACVSGLRHIRGLPGPAQAPCLSTLLPRPHRHRLSSPCLRLSSTYLLIFRSSATKPKKSLPPKPGANVPSLNCYQLMVLFKGYMKPPVSHMESAVAPWPWDGQADTVCAPSPRPRPSPVLLLSGPGLGCTSETHYRPAPQPTPGVCKIK